MVEPAFPPSLHLTRPAERAVPIRGIAARLVVNMTESLSVPTATSFREIAAARLESERRRLNDAIAPRRLSYTHLVAFAVAQAAASHPGMASSYREIDGRPHRIDPDGLSLGIAVDVEGRDGSRFLLVPVIRGAADLDFAEFAAAFDDLIERARAGRLTADDLAGATITLTNPGTLGTSASVPRLMAGQGTIVASGGIRRVAGEPVMTVSSTYDHRVIQGAESGRFLRTLDELLQGADGFYDHVASCLGAPGATVPRVTSAAGDAAVARVVPGSGEAPPGRGSPAMPLLVDVASAMALVRSYRHFGHRAARLDPLGSAPPGDPSLDPPTWGLTPDALARIPAAVLQVDVPGETLADVLPELQRTYCGTSAFEVEHLDSHEERTWLRRAIESGTYRAALSAAERRRVLERLTRVEAFERFLQRAYLGQKRFSIEGLDVLVPMLEELIELAARTGTASLEIGMAHRGRLNVLAHVVGVSYSDILGEFERGHPAAEEEPAAEGETSDVKYHRGASGTYHAAAGDVRVAVSPNPSHLEAVDPVVEGRARAEQTDRSRPDAPRDLSCALPVLIHGDAAIAGQGVVAETFNLARLRGYTTGGTIHLVANNQLGFTVDPRDGRSTDYASDIAKGFDVPIVHVNGDDPEACLAAVRLAVAYRERFHGDFLIDVVGYRRHGHNEEDEPAYTQPRMYERIAIQPSVRELYLRRLASEGIVDEAAAGEEFEAAGHELAGIQDALLRGPETPRPDTVDALGRGNGGEGSAARNGVPLDELRALNEQLLRWPAGFTVHPKLLRQLDRRHAALADDGRIAWAHAEALAFASLLLEGVPIRLTGQDTARGTFSQRHLVLHDADTGERYTPIQQLDGAAAAFELHDSPLSEYACLGFEYGYAAQAPDALVIWEAQYGDFANAAEVIVDQFIIAGLAKWGLTSRLTMLLPHGYEGQGPEHSSARPERYLALGAEGNIRVANCTTPAQYFHLLRDQALRPVPRPLVLMAPKGLLRLPEATSSPDELSAGGFQPLIDDQRHAEDRGRVRRLVLCSGRLYYELTSPEAAAASPGTAVVRVELLYPFPAGELREVLRRYGALEEIVWAQEEPWNMGARKFVLPELREVVPAAIPLLEVSRPERSSPAEGHHAAHRAEQTRIVREAIGSGGASA
jgi:2-oxoglutarate dehydrogenase E1 component